MYKELIVPQTPEAAAEEKLQKRAWFNPKLYHGMKMSTIEPGSTSPVSELLCYLSEYAVQLMGAFNRSCEKPTAYRSSFFPDQKLPFVVKLLPMLHGEGNVEDAFSKEEFDALQLDRAKLEIELLQVKERSLFYDERGRLIHETGFSSRA